MIDDELMSEFRELVNDCFDHKDDGFHFWIPVDDNWITGEVTGEDNGDLYVVIYLTERIDHLGYPLGEVLKDAYVDLDEDPPKDTELNHILEHLLN